MSTESGTVIDSLCISQWDIVFFARPYRQLIFRSYHSICVSNYSLGALAAFALTTASLIGNFGSICYLLFSNIKLKRKYQQLLYLNISSWFVAAGFMILISLPHFHHYLDRPTCQFRFCVFGMSCSIYITSLLSLTIDCLVAIFYPLRYRIIVTTRRVVIPNVVAFLLFLFFNIIYPMYAFGWRYGGYIFICDYKAIYPIWFSAVVIVLSVIIMLSLAILNIAVLLGVTRALCVRQTLTGSNARVRNQVMKLSLRLMAILTCNIGLSLPLLLSTVSIKILATSEVVFFAIFMSSGLFNIILFFIADEEIRGKLKTDLCYRFSIKNA